MTAGRKQKNEIDRLISLAQYWYLRLALSLEHHDLLVWIRALPDGSMNERDSLKFLAHKSTISERHALVIDKTVPGLSRITLLPWRMLAAYPRDRKLLKHAGQNLNSSYAKPTAPYCDRHPISKVPFVVVATDQEWNAVHDFFDRLIAFRRNEMLGFTPVVEFQAKHLIYHFRRALKHPVISKIKDELLRTFCSMLIAYNPILPMMVGTTIVDALSAEDGSWSFSLPWQFLTSAKQILISLPAGAGKSLAGAPRIEE